MDELRTDHAATLRNEKPITVKELKTFSQQLGAACEPLILCYTTGDGKKSEHFLAGSYQYNFEKLLTREGDLEHLPETIEDLKKTRDGFVQAVAKQFSPYGLNPESFAALGEAFDSAVATLEKNRSHAKGS